MKSSNVVFSCYFFNFFWLYQRTDEQKIFLHNNKAAEIWENEIVVYIGLIINQNYL